MRSFHCIRRFRHIGHVALQPGMNDDDLRGVRFARVPSVRTPRSTSVAATMQNDLHRSAISFHCTPTLAPSRFAIAAGGRCRAPILPPCGPARLTVKRRMLVQSVRPERLPARERQRRWVANEGPVSANVRQRRPRRPPRHVEHRRVGEEISLPLSRTGPQSHVTSPRLKMTIRVPKEVAACGRRKTV